MMNTTSNSIDSAVLAAPYQLNMWLGLFIWVAEAMSDFIYFDFVLITRILQKGFQIPITTRYDVLCKLRQFVSVWGNQVSFTLFSFATIDRLLSAQRSNSKFRQININ
ncbi:unnamed protein product [Rotaria sp. Silwood2]|nr:unnamed protein product [Rotaria sp. Silwood2]CAF4414448.1 unnamed protein product [Rotaria sp. Silwood2]